MPPFNFSRIIVYMVRSNQRELSTALFPFNIPRATVKSRMQRVTCKIYIQNVKSLQVIVWVRVRI